MDTLTVELSLSHCPWRRAFAWCVPGTAFYSYAADRLLFDDDNATHMREFSDQVARAMRRGDVPWWRRLAMVTHQA